MKTRIFIAAMLAVMATSAVAGRNIGYYNASGFGAFGYTMGSGGALSGLRSALESDGHTVTPFDTISTAVLGAYDVVYLQLEEDSKQASGITNEQITDLLAFNAAGGEIVWQLENGSWQVQDNELFGRLGLAGVNQTDSSADGMVYFTDTHPLLSGPHGSVSPWNTDYAIGHLDSMDPRMKSLFSVDRGLTASAPYLGCDWNGVGSASIFFLLDVNSFDNYYGNPESLALMRNMFEVDCVPEPGTMAALGLGLAALARRRRKD